MLGVGLEGLEGGEKVDCGLIDELVPLFLGQKLCLFDVLEVRERRAPIVLAQEKLCRVLGVSNDFGL